MNSAQSQGQFLCHAVHQPKEKLKTKLYQNKYTKAITWLKIKKKNILLIVTAHQKLLKIIKIKY